MERSVAYNSGGMASARSRNPEDGGRATGTLPDSSPTAHFSEISITEENRSKRNPNRLDFDVAMRDMSIMFPALERDLIESVLRENDGDVNNTVDQLLTMSLDVDEEADDNNMLPPRLPPKPPGTVDRINKVPIEPPPALPPREGSLKRRKHAEVKSSSRVLHNTPTTVYDTEWNGMTIPMLGKLPSHFLRVVHEDPPPPRPPKTILNRRATSMRTPPSRHGLERLELKPTRVNTTLSQPLRKDIHGRLITPEGERMSTNDIKRRLEANQRRIMESCDTNDMDADTLRYLEGERVALIMQNEDFLRVLKLDDDFMRTLEFERDILANKVSHMPQQQRYPHHRPRADSGTHHWMECRASERDDNSILGSPTSPSSESMSGPFSPTTDPELESESHTASQVPVDKTDDHDFRSQLKSMGTNSKRKFAILAKKFFSTARRKRKGNKTALRSTLTPSTLNLLDDNDDEDLIDVSNGGGTHDQDVDVIFEPLPGNWTSASSTSADADPMYGNSSMR